MIQLISGIIALFILIFKQWAGYDSEHKAEQQVKTKELKDAIKSGDTSAITAALSSL